MLLHQKTLQALCHLIPGAGRAHCAASGSFRPCPRSCSAPRQEDSPQASAATGRPSGRLWEMFKVQVRYLLYFSRLLLLHKPAGGVRVNHGKGVELPGLGLGEGHLGLGLGLGHCQGVAVFSRNLLLHILHLTIDKSLHLFEDCIFKNWQWGLMRELCPEPPRYPPTESSQVGQRIKEPGREWWEPSWRELPQLTDQWWWFVLRYPGLDTGDRGQKVQSRPTQFTDSMIVIWVIND